MSATRRFEIAFGCSALCVLLIPLLNLLTHPVSVLYGTDYTPLILRLDEFYERSRLEIVSFVACPLLLFGLMVVIQKERLAWMLGLTLLVGPFLVSLGAQYFIAVQADKYLRFPSLGHRIPWEHLFQLSFMSYCLVMAIVYTALCAGLYWTASCVRKKLTTT